MLGGFRRRTVRENHRKGSLPRGVFAITNVFPLIHKQHYKIDFSDLCQDRSVFLSNIGMERPSKKISFSSELQPAFPTVLLAECSAVPKPESWCCFQTHEVKARFKLGTHGRR